MREQFYLTGKVGGWKWTLVKPFLGLSNFVSSDGDHSGNDSHGWSNSTIIGPERWDHCNDGQKIFVRASALEPIRNSRALFACLNTVDSYGSIAEIAFASAIGKDCHVIICEDLTAEEKMWGDCPLYDSYWFVASYPGVTVHRVESDPEAIECLDGILKSYGISSKVEQYVYFIEAIGKDEIKIGTTADDPEKRLATFQTANAAQLSVLAKIPGDKGTECRLHARFAHIRINPRREWFRATDELRNYIATIAAGADSSI
jgi:hypothetical protein